MQRTAATQILGQISIANSLTILSDMFVSTCFGALSLCVKTVLCLCMWHMLPPLHGVSGRVHPRPSGGALFRPWCVSECLLAPR